MFETQRTAEREKLKEAQQRLEELQLAQKKREEEEAAHASERQRKEQESLELYVICPTRFSHHTQHAKCIESLHPYARRTTAFDVVCCTASDGARGPCAFMNVHCGNSMCACVCDKHCTICHPASRDVCRQAKLAELSAVLASKDKSMEDLARKSEEEKKRGDLAETLTKEREEIEAARMAALEQLEQMKLEKEQAERERKAREDEEKIQVCVSWSSCGVNDTGLWSQG